ncbi:MAG: hypothetical protein JXB10_20000 [Pirellulales bacterium]|nr:hypothetical protein [Pirellulales bacterium]
MRRRDFLTGIVLASLAIPASSQAATTRFDAETMKAALRTTRIEDQGFIDDVLVLVGKGVLPADLVDSTFAWARRKHRHRFQYFKYGLIYRANKLGIRI